VWIDTWEFFQNLPTLENIPPPKVLFEPLGPVGEEKKGGSVCVGGGTNRSDKGLNLSGSWQQGHSATYNTPSRI
jgi:hypothetical protein